MLQLSCSIHCVLYVLRSDVLALLEHINITRQQSLKPSQGGTPWTAQLSEHLPAPIQTHLQAAPGGLRHRRKSEQWSWRSTMRTCGCQEDQRQQLCASAQWFCLLTCSTDGFHLTAESSTACTLPCQLPAPEIPLHGTELPAPSCN